MQKLQSFLWKVGREPIFQIVQETRENLAH